MGEEQYRISIICAQTTAMGESSPEQLQFYWKVWNQ